MSVKLSLSVFLAIFAVAFSSESAHARHKNHVTSMSESNQTGKVNISVYYEALCKDSSQFITTKLYPLIFNESSALYKHLELTLVPFGKSNLIVTINETNPTAKEYNMTCHHGPEECLGNRYQACAIDAIANKSLLYKYINCTMARGIDTKGTNYSIAKTCADDVKLDNFDVIVSCVTENNGSKSFELEEKYQNMTNTLVSTGLKNVPSVAFNGVFNADKQAAALSNLKKALCSEISGSDQLAECKTNGASPLSMSLVMLILTMAVSRLY